MADNVQTSSDRLRWAALVVDYLARPLIAAELSRLPSAFPFSEPATRIGQPNGTRSNRCRCGAVPVHSGRHMLSDRRARNGLTKARQPRKELVVSYQNEGKTRSPVPAVSVSTVRFVKFTGGPCSVYIRWYEMRRAAIARQQP